MRFNLWSWLGLASNIVTIAVTLAFLILMLGLGRRHRGNQSFASFLFLVFIWIISGQSTQVLLWLGQGNPTFTLHTTSLFFFFQAIALFYFAGHLVGLKRLWFQLSAAAGLAIGLVGLIPLANNQIIANPSLSPTGLLRWHIYLIGYALVAIAFAYLVASPLLLLAHRRQVPHPLLVIGTGIVAVAEITGICGSLFSLPFPLLALGVTAGITTLGSSMVYFQLFKPLSEMTLELEARQADLEEQNQRLEEANAQLRELDEWKEKTTHMVIHDLKTPLSIISVVLQECKNNLAAYLSDTQNKLLQSALISERRIQSLVSSMLDVHRLEEGHLPINPAPIDPIPLIDDCIQAANPLLELYEITIDVDRPAKSLLAFADPAVTARVVENLLDNAIKFSPSPGTVTVRAYADLDKVHFSISDTGPGIPPADQQRIFEKYSQIVSPARDTRPGFGLGLAFCKLTLEAQRGNIWVESDGHNGATFHFTLPMWTEPAHKSIPPSEIAGSLHE
jgi:signal transduction histidine kinase